VLDTFLVVFFGVAIVVTSCVNQASNIAYCTHSTPNLTHSQGGILRRALAVSAGQGEYPFDPCRHPPDAPHGREITVI